MKMFVRVWQSEYYIFPKEIKNLKQLSDKFTFHRRNDIQCVVVDNIEIVAEYKRKETDNAL